MQAAYLLANLANGHEGHQELILSHAVILAALRTCIAHSKTDIRRPTIACVLELARNHPKRRKDIIDAGIASTLQHICEWGGGLSLSPGGRTLHGPHAGAVEDDKDVIEVARTALEWLDHDDISVP